MIEVTTAVEVAMPAARAFALVSDAENNPRWQEGMRSCRWATDEEIHVGSIYHQEARFLGRPIRSTFVVTTFEPGRSVRADYRRLQQLCREEVGAAGAPSTEATGQGA